MQPWVFLWLRMKTKAILKCGWRRYLSLFQKLKRGVSSTVEYGKQNQETREEQKQTSHKKPPNPPMQHRHQLSNQKRWRNKSAFSWTSVIRRHSSPWDPTTKLSQGGRPILWPPQPLLHSRNIFGSAFFDRSGPISVFLGFLSSRGGREKRRKREEEENY